MGGGGHRILRRSLLGILCLALSVVALSSVLQAQVPAGAGGQAAGRVGVLIGFSSTPTQADEALVRSAGGQVKYRYHLVPAIAANIPERAVAALLAQPRVTVIEPDGEVFALDHEAELNNTWGVKHIGAGSVHHTSAIQGVAVAVIDSGIDYTHPELGNRFAGGHDFVNGDDDPMDDNGHGTHVAGSVAAEKDGAGVVGAAPLARLYGLKILSASGSGQWSDVIAALQWAVDRRDADPELLVTNNSYGAGRNPGSIVEAAFDSSAEAGLLHVAAAGNSGNCGGRGNNVGYPARFSSVIAVGATNKSDARPCFSSTGPALELAAPGVSIRSTVPGGGYADWSGTSMASPHVAGVAALVISAGVEDWNGNGRVNDEVRAILTATAKDLGAEGWDPQYGHGLVDAPAAVSAVGEGGEGSDSDSGGDSSDPPPASGNVSVESIAYATSGGPNRDRHLSVTVAVVDDGDAAVSGASVSVEVANGSSSRSGTATTGSDGTVTFTWNNAPSGCYETTVTAVVADGLTWNGSTPENGACK